MSDWKNKIKAVDARIFADDKRATPRDRFITGLQKQIAMFRDQAIEGKRHFKVVGQHVRFTARLGNQVVELMPKTREVQFPVKDFPTIMDGIIADAQAGDFDDQLEALSSSYMAKRQATKDAKAAAAEVVGGAKPAAGAKKPA